MRQKRNQKQKEEIKKLRVNSPFPESNEVLWDRYDLEYGYLNVKDKTILDIGADVGTTADYWLQHGAKKIYAIEGDTEEYNQLVKNIEIMNWKNIVVSEKMFICGVKQFEYLLTTYKTDIVKIDCEGCEEHWLFLRDEIFSLPDQYLVEFHSPFLLGEGIKKLSKNGYKLEQLITVNDSVTVVLYKKQEG
jgi:hypothetical protein